MALSPFSAGGSPLTPPFDPRDPSFDVPSPCSPAYMPPLPPAEQVARLLEDLAHVDMSLPRAQQIRVDLVVEGVKNLEEVVAEHWWPALKRDALQSADPAACYRTAFQERFVNELLAVNACGDVRELHTVLDDWLWNKFIARCPADPDFKRTVTEGVPNSWQPLQYHGASFTHYHYAGDWFRSNNLEDWQRLRMLTIARFGLEHEKQRFLFRATSLEHYEEFLANGSAFGVGLGCVRPHQDFSHSDGVYFHESFEAAVAWARKAYFEEPVILIFRVPLEYHTLGQYLDLNAGGDQWADVIKAFRTRRAGVESRRRFKDYGVISGPLCENPNDVDAGLASPEMHSVIRTMQVCIRLPAWNSPLLEYQGACSFDVSSPISNRTLSEIFSSTPSAARAAAVLSADEATSMMSPRSGGVDFENMEVQFPPLPTSSVRETPRSPVPGSPSSPWGVCKSP